ncbi:MGDG synthase family glycosyltransferase [Longirhabdus pacifica]|uniref:MGDG synthase family glycosyltransferase n=1 Tax=Longirhabdus pacifica TaxID=2305227 RepID=UPI0010092E1E|nr:glycosyltransferase [Longirhabdus pacifica]
MNSKKVLILSEGFGSGHTKAAESIQAQLKATDPSITVYVVELANHLHPLISSILLRIYVQMIKWKPNWYSRMYSNASDSPLRWYWSFIIHKVLYADTLSIMKEYNPDMIICTHPFPNIVVSKLKKSGALDLPLHTVITDYAAHQTWISEETDLYFAPSIKVKQQLMMKGVPKAKIKMTGVPIHPKFWNLNLKKECKNYYHLKPIPTVLIMGGGWGMLDKSDKLKELLCWKDKLQFIICTGNNVTMKKKLQSNPAFQHPHIQILGFTSEVDVLMDIADLLVTKPGGMTCTEAMAKQLPMLFYDVIPGHEESNSRHFIDLGLAMKIDSEKVIHNWFHKLANEYDEVVKKRSELRLHHHPSIQCGEVIVEELYRQPMQRRSILQNTYIQESKSVW